MDLYKILVEILRSGSKSLLQPDPLQSTSKCSNKQYINNDEPRRKTKGHSRQSSDLNARYPSIDKVLLIETIPMLPAKGSVERVIQLKDAERLMLVGTARKEEYGIHL
ncbi:hypothetical protein RF11_05862 [Thelohanellus kitauei]|uniref:Uncharacterized protein n=1 Tax=Thelohanellus kitauei TaxID=669202 RepID=A0A0C2M9Z9_THEKT|nr:hypothetical protein RF11_05862 [Thelohanellus kitauei]